MTTADPVRRFLDAVENATIPSCDAWAIDAVVDATVPNWRFAVRGADAVRAEYERWFGVPSRLEDLRRLPTPQGEVVEYVVSWTENDIPHAAHHVHVLTVHDGRIVADTVMCGGRWPASLLAEMEAEANA
jgi:hypothetical protein